jgi:hypothetical protein
VPFPDRGPPVKKTYVLVDYENVQPKDLALLDGQAFEVVVFLGEHQNKIPLELAAALQQRGARGRYVQISGNGRNALDFHIAFHLGELAAKNADASFHVISKDGGFDPLVEYLRAKRIDVRRFESLGALVAPRKTARSEAAPTEPAPTEPAPSEDQLAAVITRLISMGPARPRKTKTLASTINAMFGKGLEEAAIQGLIDALARRHEISVKDGKVTYPARKS